METLLELIIEFFDEEGWSCSREDEEAVMVSFLSLKGERHLLAQAAEEQLCIFTSFAPLEVPQERHFHVLEFLNLMNGRIATGALYLDFEGGSVQFTTHVDPLDHREQIVPKEPLFAHMRRAVYYGQQALALLIPHIESVMAGLDIEEAVANAMRDLENFYS